MLAEIYQIDFSKTSGLVSQLDEIAKECPDNSDNLVFNLAFQRHKKVKLETSPVV